MPKPKELWGDIPGFEGFYQVSDLGKVRSVTREITIQWRGRTKKVIYLGKNISPGPGKTGYGIAGLSKRSKVRYWYVHRLVLLVFRGPPPKGYECCHNNGDKKDNRLSNLRYGTRSENALDRHRHGTMISWRGEEVPSAKLDNSKVKWIRRNRGGLSFRAMGRRLGVSHSTISSVVYRRSWNHLR